MMQVHEKKLLKCIKQKRSVLLIGNLNDNLIYGLVDYMIMRNKLEKVLDNEDRGIH